MKGYVMDELQQSIIDGLTAKLTDDELSILCDWHDDGRLNTQFEERWLPKDKESNPEKYHH